MLIKGEAGVLNGFFFALAIGLITSGMVMVVFFLTATALPPPDDYYSNYHKIKKIYVSRESATIIPAFIGGFLFLRILGIAIYKNFRGS